MTILLLNLYSLITGPGYPDADRLHFYQRATAN